MVAIDVDNLVLRYRVRQKLTLAVRAKPLPTGGQITGSGRHKFVQALDGVSFSLRAGDRLGLIGANGSGKTTLLKVLYGIFQPSAGRVDVSGKVDALFNINLGFRSEASGRRNIELRGLINGWDKPRIQRSMDEIIEFSELGDFIDMPFKSYSQGMAARLAFSVATTLRPEILLMDEWIGAGDAAFREKAAERMTRLTSEAGIVVIASHSPSLINRVCNKALELEKGRIKRVIDLAAEPLRINPQAV